MRVFRLFVSLLGLISVFAISGCKNETISNDPSLRLSFSKDSICFDTVFTGIGSSTQKVMVYNPNRNALRIDQVTLRGTHFQINLDGENDTERLHDITLNGGDSLFMFVRVNVTSSTPVFVTDSVHFFVNGNEQAVHLEAYGLNVRVLRDSTRHTTLPSFTFLADSSYLLFDTVTILGETRIEAGATVFMHNAANLYCHGGIHACGTREHPVRIMGDRTDKLFEHVPYKVASGQWGGLYLLQAKDAPVHQDTLNYVEIWSGNIGLYSASESPANRSHLTLCNSRIHNHAIYGIVLSNTDADLWNNEISNCASYCLYLQGGTHLLTHNTIASFFGWPNSDLNIHNVSREDVAAVYINNLSKEMAPTAVTMHNCIVTGVRKNNIVVATPLPEYYEGEFVGNYLRADTLQDAFAHNNVYAQDSDVVFRNAYYKYKEYKYFDFHLDSLSAAAHIADSTLVKAPWEIDRDECSRLNRQPSAGCYESAY